MTRLFVSDSRGEAISGKASEEVLEFFWLLSCGLLLML
jgi:hypothetical protein